MTDESLVPSRNSFAVRLRQAMALRDTNRAQVAASIGVDPKTVGNWASDDARGTEPTASNLLSLCEVLGVSADYLLGRADDPSGLTPGTWLVDLAELEAARPGGKWATKVPRRHQVVSDEAVRKLRAEAGKKGTRKGGKDGSP